jgi:hypothetical protein
VGGEDCEGLVYESIEQMWQFELDPKVAEIISSIKGKEFKGIGTKDDWYNG